MNRSRRAGFTLIELLVVIAIIAILAAILFPVFARARGKARQSACSSNMKQLGLAIISYAADYDGQTCYWDLSPTPGFTGVDWPTWDKQILPYMKNTGILICPDNPYNKQDNNLNQGSAPKRGYAMPRYISGCNQDDPPNPVETALLVEKGGYTPFTEKDAASEHPRQAGQGNDYTASTMRHNGGLNFVFVDGHVKWQNSGSGVWTNDGNDPANCPGTGGGGYLDHCKGHIEFPQDWPAGAG